jgi:hypothetical protein
MSPLADPDTVEINSKMPNIIEQYDAKYVQVSFFPDTYILFTITKDAPGSIQVRSRQSRLNRPF